MQDVSVGYGKSKSQYTEIKRVVKDKDIGPLIETEMTRCIQCTRCVRFGDEIAGMREMGGIGRGDRLEIGTYLEKSLKSNSPVTIIDICPTVLTAKPSRYKARAWEMMKRMNRLLPMIQSVPMSNCIPSVRNWYAVYRVKMKR